MAFILDLSHFATTGLPQRVDFCCLVKMAQDVYGGAITKEKLKKFNAQLQGEDLLERLLPLSKACANGGEQRRDDGRNQHDVVDEGHYDG